MFAYEVFHHLHAFFRVQIENPYPSRTEPVEAAAKCSALAYDQCADAELTHQAAAVPAGRQSSHHHNIAVGAESTRAPKSISLRVDRGIALLYPSIVSRAE